MKGRGVDQGVSVSTTGFFSMVRNRGWGHFCHFNMVTVIITGSLSMRVVKDGGVVRVSDTLTLSLTGVNVPRKVQDRGV